MGRPRHRPWAVRVLMPVWRVRCVLRRRPASVSMRLGAPRILRVLLRSVPPRGWVVAVAGHAARRLPVRCHRPGWGKPWRVPMPAAALHGGVVKRLVSNEWDDMS